MELTRERLQEIYQNNSNLKATKILKISVPTLMKMLRGQGIALKGQGRKKGQTKWRIV